MKIYINNTNHTLADGVGSSSEPAFVFFSEDLVPLEIVFFEGDAVVDPASVSSIRVALGRDGSLLAFSDSFTKSGTGTTAVWSGNLNLNTQQMAFATGSLGNTDVLVGVLEVETKNSSGNPITKAQVLVTIKRDLINETDNETDIGTITTAAAHPHSHPISDITNLQNSLNTKLDKIDGLISAVPSNLVFRSKNLCARVVTCAFTGSYEEGELIEQDWLVSSEDWNPTNQAYHPQGNWDFFYDPEVIYSEEESPLVWHKSKCPNYNFKHPTQDKGIILTQGDELGLEVGLGTINIPPAPTNGELGGTASFSGVTFGVMSASPNYMYEISAEFSDKRYWGAEALFGKVSTMLPLYTGQNSGTTSGASKTDLKYYFDGGGAVGEEGEEGTAFLPLPRSLPLPSRELWHSYLFQHYNSSGQIIDRRIPLVGDKIVIILFYSKYRLDFPESGNATTSQIVLGSDSRLTDSRTPTPHAHGSITDDGKIGSISNLPLITGAGGVIQAGSFGITANTFCQGNDSRLGLIRKSYSAYSFASTTASTADQWQYTLAIPPNSLGLNGYIQGHIWASCSASTSAKRIRAYLTNTLPSNGGNAIPTASFVRFLNLSTATSSIASTAVSIMRSFVVLNKNSTNAQIAFPSASGGIASTTSSDSFEEMTFNTTQTLYLVIGLQKDLATDTLTLRGVNIELAYGGV